MNKNLKTAIKIGLTLCLLVFFYGRMDFSELRSQISNLRLYPLVGFFVICVVNMGVSSYRWKLLLDSDSIRVSYAKLFTSHWIASFFNFFAPSNIGGDAYRIADIAKKTGKGTKTFASVFADRLTGFLAMSMLGFIFPLTGLRGVPVEHRWKLFIPLSVFFVFLLVAVLIWQQTFLRCLCRLLPGKLRDIISGILDKFFESFEAYSSRKMVLVLCFGLSVVFQFLVIVAAFCVGSAMNLGIPFFEYCVFMPLVCILESTPGTINGMGFRDAAYLMFFNAAGVPEADTVAPAMALLYLTLTLIYASFGGLVFLRRMAKS